MLVELDFLEITWVCGNMALSTILVHQMCLWPSYGVCWWNYRRPGILGTQDWFWNLIRRVPISLIQNGCSNIHSYSNFVNSIKVLVNRQWEVKVTHVHRKSNIAVDCLVLRVSSYLIVYYKFDMMSKEEDKREKLWIWIFYINKI